MTIGESIRKQRLDRGWTQTELSSRTDIAMITISFYENDRFFPSVISLIALADAFEISLDELVGRKVQE